MRRRCPAAFGPLTCGSGAELFSFLVLWPLLRWKQSTRFGLAESGVKRRDCVRPKAPRHFPDAFFLFAARCCAYSEGVLLRRASGRGGGRCVVCAARCKKCKEMLPKPGSDDPDCHPSSVGLTEEHRFPEQHLVAQPQTAGLVARAFGSTENFAGSWPAQFRVGADTGIGWLRAAGVLRK